MSDINKKYVDYAGLQKYDELIKGQILSDAANAASTAVNALDTTNDVGIASVSNDIVTLKAGVKQRRVLAMTSFLQRLQRPVHQVMLHTITQPLAFQQQM